MTTLAASTCSIYSGVKDLVSVDVTERIHLNCLSTKVRNTVIKGLTHGVIASLHGQSGFIYRVLCKKYDIPPSFANAGDVIINTAYSEHTTQTVRAKHVLAGGSKQCQFHSLYESPLTAKDILGVIAEEYKAYKDQVACALRDIEDNITLVFHTHIN